MMVPLRILVLRTGEPIAPVLSRRGSFARLFEEGLGLGGRQVHVVEHDVTAHGAQDPLPSLQGFDGAVMTGSPAYVGDDAPWMRFGAKLLQKILDEELPFLGVCFGHQLLGVATGCDVGENPRGREMGTTEVELEARGDPLLAALPSRMAVQVTHRDVIRAPSARVSVIGRAPHDPCHVVRAGRVAWGVQFHPEFDVEVMGAYLQARRALMDEAHGEGAAERRLSALRETPEATSVLARFADVVAARRAPARREVSVGA